MLTVINPAVEAITKHAQGWLQQGKERKIAEHI